MIPVFSPLGWRSRFESSSAGIRYADDFNRANTTAPGLGASWNDLSSQFFVNTNQCRKNDGDHAAKFVQSLGSPDHWIEAALTNMGQGNAVCIHGRSPTNNAWSTGYCAFANGTTYEIGKLVSGTYTTVVSGGTIGSTSEKLRLELQGSAQRLYANGVLKLTGADTAIASGSFVGFNCQQNPGFTVSYDDFRCGTFPYTP